MDLTMPFLVATVYSTPRAIARKRRAAMRNRRRINE